MTAWILAASARAATADFDALTEGTNGSVITDGGLTFTNLDNRGVSPPPGNIAIDQADADLGGMAGFTATNALGFGGYSPGPNGAFGRFGSIEISSGGLGESAEVNVFENGGYAGTVLRLEALLGGVTVATDSDPLSGGFGIVGHTLTVSGATFDTLRVSIGPGATDVAFLLIDHVTIDPPTDSGDTGATPTTAPTGDTGAVVAPDSADTGTTEGDADTDTDSDADTDADGDADSDPVPTTTDSGTTTDPKGCGCDAGAGAGGAWLLAAALIGRRRR
jgi:hypothetical protein